MWKFAVFCVMGISGWASGQLFAVDNGTSLVTVDPDTGAVTVIGNIDTKGSGIRNLEFIGSRLYAIDTVALSNGWLIEIDTTDATVLSRAPLTFNGGMLSNAVEGLGYDPALDSLIISFWQSNAQDASNSNTLGTLELDGIISNSVSYGSGGDFDGLATKDNDGTLYRVDRDPPSMSTEISTVSYGGSITSLIVFNFDATINGVNDVTLAPDRNELLAVDVVTRKVHRLDPETATIIGSIDYPPSFSLNTPAYLVPCLADLNNDGSLDFFDISEFLTLFSTGDLGADFIADGLLDFFDISAFLSAFTAGCS